LPTTVANTERTSIIVPIGPSTLSPKIGRSVREIKPNGGLHYLFGVPNNVWVQSIIIVVVTILFLASAWSQVKRLHLQQSQILKERQ
jgi:hypothetical protein